MLDVALKPRRSLVPSDFTAQLYLVVGELASRAEASERQAVYYGQQHFKLPIVRRQVVDGLLIYDRYSGGEPLIEGSFRNVRSFTVFPLDTIILECVEWP
jgi:hypothetical protein